MVTNQRVCRHSLRRQGPGITCDRELRCGNATAPFLEFPARCHGREAPQHRKPGPSPALERADESRASRAELPLHSSAQPP